MADDPDVNTSSDEDTNDCKFHFSTYLTPFYLIKTSKIR